ncbi:hypothetical protein AAVH_28906 [Aphelenchoides avenae]|nr:hypothetical protein AAVH_28906 [Aphelenchus avenae]
MDVSVKGEPSEVAEAMDATLYEDVMENGIKMETIEVDDSIPPTYEPSCNSRPPGGSITTPRRGNTKLMTINVRRTLQGIVVTPIHSARTMWSHQAASRIPASGSVKRFTVVVPRRTPYDERFEQPSGKYTERSVGLVQANIGTSSAAIPLNSEEACAEGSDEQPEVMRDVLPTSTKNDDTTATSDLAVEAGSSQNHVAAHQFRRRRHELRKRAQRELVEAERQNTELKAISNIVGELNLPA